jgi:hypothetical protein
MSVGMERVSRNAQIHDRQDFVSDGDRVLFRLRNLGGDEDNQQSGQRYFSDHSDAGNE